MEENKEMMGLSMKFWRLQHLMNLYRMQSNRKPHEMEVMRGQGRVLSTLQIVGDISSKDLAFILRIRQQSLNESLIKLEDSGYIVREHPDDDRRRVIIKLTDKGKKTKLESPTEMEKIFDCLSQEERENFSAALDKIREELLKELPEDLEEQMADMRERMGDERFHMMMSMRGWGAKMQHKPPHGRHHGWGGEKPPSPHDAHGRGWGGEKPPSPHNAHGRGWGGEMPPSPYDAHGRGWGGEMPPSPYDAHGRGWGGEMPPSPYDAHGRGWGGEMPPSSYDAHGRGWGGEMPHSPHDAYGRGWGGEMPPSPYDAYGRGWEGEMPPSPYDAYGRGWEEEMPPSSSDDFEDNNNDGYHPDEPEQDDQE